jgi:hypothetical protein
MFQWYYNGNPYSGATGSTLSFANARGADAGEYYVVATNPLGAATSSKATLNIAAGSASSPATTGGGGGGAIENWFILTLLALGATRRQAASSSPSAGDGPHE